MLSKKGLIFARKQITISTVVVLLYSCFAYFYQGAEYALSAFVGGFVVIVPHIVFTYKTFKYSGARSAEKVIESFYSGEKIKIVLTVILVAIAFKFIAINPVPFFTSFSLVVALPLLTPFLFKL